MGVGSVGVSDNTIGATGRAASGTGDTSQELQNNFLTLLIAQMQNQDPTNPMDNSQLITQLAQISTLAGIERLNTSLGVVSGQMDDSLAVSAAKLIGRGVMVPGDRILVATSTDSEEGSEAETITTPFGFEIPREAESVVVTITDSTGKVIREVDLGKTPAGVSSFSWDGLQDDGSVAPDGSYTFSVNATTDGQKIPATALSYSVVYGVINSSVNNAVLLDLGLSGTVSVNEVRQIL